MKKVSRFAKLNTTTDFNAITEASIAMGQIPIGYKKRLEDGSLEIVTNPKKAVPISFAQDDCIIFPAQED